MKPKESESNSGQVLIPVLQAARAELGEERANRLILGALRAWCRERFKQAGARTPGTLKEKWDTLKKLDGERTRDHRSGIRHSKVGA